MRQYKPLTARRYAENGRSVWLFGLAQASLNQNKSFKIFLSKRDVFVKRFLLEPKFTNIRICEFDDSFVHRQFHELLFLEERIINETIRQIKEI